MLPLLKLSIIIIIIKYIPPRLNLLLGIKTNPSSKIKLV